MGGTGTVRAARVALTSEMRTSRKVRGSPRSRSWPTRYQCPWREPVHHGSTRRVRGSEAPAGVCEKVRPVPSATASATRAAVASSAGSATETVAPASWTGSIPAAVSLASAPPARAALSPSRHTSAATASTPACSGVSVISGSSYPWAGMRYPAGEPGASDAPCSSGTPTSRSSRLSRSNIRRKAFSDSQSS